MPQASEKEPFIHHAIVAIGALSKVSKDARDFHCQNICREWGSNFAEEYTYALSHYDKALKGMVKAMEAGIQDLRIALLACLLAFCMETLHGHQGPACALAIRGMELFNNQTIDYESSIPEKQPRPQPLEDELVHAFADLDIHVLFFLDDRPLALHQRIIDHVNLVLKSMPPEFEDLAEAGRYLLRITRRNMHFKSNAQVIGKADGLAGERGGSGWTDAAEFSAGRVP